MPQTHVQVNRRRPHDWQFIKGGNRLSGSGSSKG
jgi:hypothetical protein